MKKVNQIAMPFNFLPAGLFLGSCFLCMSYDMKVAVGCQHKSGQGLCNAPGLEIDTGVAGTPMRRTAPVGLDGARNVKASLYCELFLLSVFPFFTRIC